MECNKIQEQLSAYFGDALSPAEKDIINNHLKSCPGCRAYLAELEMTVVSIKNLEEIIPPPWLTQKIMNRIKTESVDKKSSLLQKIFFPLYIKLPLEAVGIFLIGITALYVFKSMEPEIKTTAAPSEKAVPEFAAQQKNAPAESIGKKPAETAPFRKFRKVEETSPGAPSVQDSNYLPAQPSEPRMNEKDLSLKEKPAEEQKHSEKKMLLRSAPSPAGVQAYDELKKEETTRASGKEASGLSAKEDISLEIKAGNLDSAKTDIKEILSNLGGRAIKEEVTSVTILIVGELGSDKLLPFMQKLKMLGYVKEKIPAPVSDKDRVLIKITVSRP